MYRITVIDDDAMMQGVLRQILTHGGYEVLLCSDGEKGLADVAADRPDLVLLDINLPDMDGHEVCRRLKADERVRHIPVVMLTGEARDLDSRVRGLDCGADDYMFKPVAPKLLLSRVASLLKHNNPKR